MEFSTLCQLLRSYLNFYAKRANLGVGGAFLIIVLIVAPLQQGLCLTAEEIAYLKKAGVSDETIQLMIQQENEGKRNSRTGVWEVEDEKGDRATLYHAGNDDRSLERERIEQEKVDRAWEMLRNLVIDAREKE